MPPTRPVQQGKRQHGATHPGLAQQKSPTPVSVGLGRKGRRGAAPYLTQAHQCSISARLASRCSVGLRRKPERAKRCRRPNANEVNTLAWTWLYCAYGDFQEYFNVLFDQTTGLVRSTSKSPVLLGRFVVAPTCFQY